MRIGSGFDVHRLVEGRKLILGGVEIPYEKGLLGHSDADVLVHAVMDAILGALGKRDIGVHFPDTDAQYKDISSLVLLTKVVDLMKQQGYRIGNLDVTVVAQRPKLKDYIPGMLKNLADVLECEISKLNIKATTTEGLGFEGRGEGISAGCVCLIEKL